VSKVRKRDVEDVAGAVHVAVLSANVRPSSAEALPFWVQTITARVVADHTRRGKRRGKYAGEMPDLDATVVDDSVFDLGAREPADVNVTPWLERQVADSPRDAETLEILKEKAQNRKTYAELAEALGLSEATLKKRVARFADKYAEQRRLANRERGLLLLLLAIGGAVAVYVLMKWVVTPDFERVDPDRAVPTNSSRNTAPPPEEQGVSSPYVVPPDAP
jgi:DNA-directed RNA polymerase specialized sigma24 family protein